MRKKTHSNDICIYNSSDKVGLTGRSQTISIKHIFFYGMFLKKSAEYRGLPQGVLDKSKDWIGKILEKLHGFETTTGGAFVV